LLNKTKYGYLFNSKHRNINKIRESYLGDNMLDDFLCKILPKLAQVKSLNELIISKNSINNIKNIFENTYHNVI